MPEVIMPKMGDAMEEGTLLKWLKSEGDDVSEGDPIAEIETDKVTMELEAEDAGTLAQLIAEEGQDVPVGGAIAFIQGEGEDVPERSEGGGEAEEDVFGSRSLLDSAVDVLSWPFKPFVGSVLASVMRLLSPILNGALDVNRIEVGSSTGCMGPFLQQCGGVVPPRTDILLPTN